MKNQTQSIEKSHKKKLQTKIHCSLMKNLLMMKKKMVHLRLRETTLQSQEGHPGSANPLQIHSLPWKVNPTVNPSCVSRTGQAAPTLQCVSPGNLPDVFCDDAHNSKFLWHHRMMSFHLATRPFSGSHNLHWTSPCNNLQCCKNPTSAVSKRMARKKGTQVNCSMLGSALVFHWKLLAQMLLERITFDAQIWLQPQKGGMETMKLCWTKCLCFCCVGRTSDQFCD